MEPTEIIFHPHDLHAFFFGKAIDLAIAERSPDALHTMTSEGTFYEYIASTARILHSQYEISVMDRERAKNLMTEDK